MNSAASQDKAQEEVISFLSKPGAFPDSEEAAVCIETHAALIFLAGSGAYKLKRAVKLPYLDFSTLGLRRKVLERELELNSRITPDLYLSILPVTRSPDGSGIRVGGTGEVLDWVLAMRRFDQDALFDAMAAKGQIELGHIAALAGTIEHFHRQAHRMTENGFRDHIAHVAGDLEAVLCGPEAEKLGLHVKPYISRLREELDARQALMAAREQEGFIRQCHGDLHLRNIVLWEGKPRLFDAAEFDVRLANIDVLYDLAFLLMDLWHRGLTRHANAILNHYLERAAMSEIQGLALLPLFMSIRAAIRAMTGMHALAHKTAATQEEAIADIKSYASLASRLLERGPPILAAVGGVSGTGKTSAAREAAPFIGAAPGALHIRSDAERKVMQGVAFDQPLPRQFYTTEMRDEVYRRIFKKAELALDAGHSVIADAVFPEEASRAQLCELAHRTGALFWGFWLEAGAETVKSRIKARSGDASDADGEIAEAQLKTVAIPLDWIKIDASGTVEASASAIAGALRS